MSARSLPRRVALGLGAGVHEVTLIHKLWCWHLLHSLEHLHVGHHVGLVSLSGRVGLCSRVWLELCGDHLLIHSKLLLLHVHGVLHHLNVLLLGHWLAITTSWHLHHRHLSTHRVHHIHLHLRHLGLRILGLIIRMTLSWSFLVFRCLLLRFSFFNGFFRSFINNFCDLSRQVSF